MVRRSRLPSPPPPSRRLAAILLAVLAVTAGAAAAQTPAPSQAQEVTPAELALQKRLMAPCCWAGTLDNHDSPVANEMKAAIRTRLARGDAPDAILAGFVAQYGARVLAEPPARGLDALVYILPVLALLLGAGIVVAFLRRQTRAAPAAAAGPGEPPASPDAALVEQRLRRRR